MPYGSLLTSRRSSATIEAVMLPASDGISQEKAESSACSPGEVREEAGQLSISDRTPCFPNIAFAPVPAFACRWWDPPGELRESSEQLALTLSGSILETRANFASLSDLRGRIAELVIIDKLNSLDCGPTMKLKTAWEVRDRIA